MMLLPLYPLRLCFTGPKAEMRAYAGSAWRGGFGHALKKLVCIFKQEACEHCPLAASCAYTIIFEPRLAIESPRGITSPYTLYPVAEAQDLHLYVTVMGEKAISFFPFILHALRLAGERGIGGRAYSFEVVEHFDHGAWKALASQPVALSTIPEAPGHGLRLHLITPARFKYQGHFVGPDTLTPALWIRALRRRLISLAAAWGDEAGMRRICDVDENMTWQAPELRWQEMERYSSRQHTAMKIGGVAGAFELTASQVQQLWPMLWLGQWTHIGKFATMGMGRYALLPLSGECKK